MKQDFFQGFLILVILMSMVFAGCFSSGSARKKPYYLQPPPGGVAINDTLWFDRTEITNMDWLEYTYWINRVMPEEYHANLPDTNVWIRDYGIGMDTSYQSLDFMLLYLRHPKYYYYPVIGISQEQAERYTSWRAARVFENYLVNHGIIAPNWQMDSTNYFSIDRLFRGEYETLKPIDTIRYYPHYRLPSP